MGDVADAMLDGTLCACCGVYVGDSAGYAVYCSDCAGDFNYRTPSKDKIKCVICNKTVKQVGLQQHMRDKHGENQP